MSLFAEKSASAAAEEVIYSEVKSQPALGNCTDITDSLSL